jgi:hypothetical protein
LKSVKSHFTSYFYLRLVKYLPFSNLSGIAGKTAYRHSALHLTDAAGLRKRKIAAYGGKPSAAVSFYISDIAKWVQYTFCLILWADTHSTFTV